jgi:hypothetical protein
MSHGPEWGTPYTCMQVLKVGLESQNIGKRRDSLRWTRGCLKGAGTRTNRVVMPAHRKTKHDRSMNYTTAKLLRDGRPGAVLWQEENDAGPNHQGRAMPTQTECLDSRQDTSGLRLFSLENVSSAPCRGTWSSRHDAARLEAEECVEL